MLEQISGEGSARYTCDAPGCLSRAVNADSDVRFVRDEQGRLATETRAAAAFPEAKT